MTHPQLTPGTVLADRYRLDERIGRGGMADVFRGRDQLLDRDIAVKVFRFDTVDGTEQRRIEAEMRTLAAVRHPALVTLYDAFAGDASGTPPFLVMEYISGPTLAQRLTRGPLPPEEAAALGADLAAALEHVHAGGIVHRDVKPANILLDQHGGRALAKLTDFGIARLTQSARLTATGTTIGTANYLSPEQARGADVGPASDIYSLGLVLIECLTGLAAFPGSGVESAVARLSRGPQIPQQFGAQWAGLLAAMTASNPADRPDANAVQTTLATLPADGATAQLASDPATGSATVPLAPVGAVAGTAVLPPPPAPRSRLPLVLGAALAIAVLAAVLAVVLDSGSGGKPTPGVPAHRSSAPHQPTSPVARRSSAQHRRSTSVPPGPSTHSPPAPKPKPPKPKPKPKPKPHPPKPPKHGHGPGHKPGHRPGHGPGPGQH